MQAMAAQQTQPKKHQRRTELGKEKGFESFKDSHVSTGTCTWQRFKLHFLAMGCYARSLWLDVESGCSPRYIKDTTGRQCTSKLVASSLSLLALSLRLLNRISRWGQLFIRVLVQVYPKRIYVLAVGHPNVQFLLFNPKVPRWEFSPLPFTEGTFSWSLIVHQDHHN